MSGTSFNFTRNWLSYLNGQFIMGRNSEITKNVAYLFIAVATFHVWQERDARLHNSGSARYPYQIRQLVFRMIREKLFSNATFKKAVSQNRNIVTLLY